eukprot:1337261-Pyramimonas_sp.AAC.1
MRFPTDRMQFRGPIWGKTEGPNGSHYEASLDPYSSNVTCAIVLLLVQVRVRNSLWCQASNMVSTLALSYTSIAICSPRVLVFHRYTVSDWCQGPPNAM